MSVTVTDADTDDECITCGPLDYSRLGVDELSPGGSLLDAYGAGAGAGAGEGVGAGAWVVTSVKKQIDLGGGQLADINLCVVPPAELASPSSLESL